MKQSGVPYSVGASLTSFEAFKREFAGARRLPPPTRSNASYLPRRSHRPKRRNRWVACRNAAQHRAGTSRLPVYHAAWSVANPPVLRSARDERELCEWTRFPHDSFLFVRIPIAPANLVHHPCQMVRA